MQIERSAGNSRRGTRTTWHGSRPTANRRYTRGLTATGTSTCQCCQCCQCLASIGYPHNAITAETRLAPLSRDCCASMPDPPLSAQHSRESGAQRVSGASLDECAAGCEAVEHTGFGDGQHQIPGHHAADKHAAGDLGNHVHNATRADE